MVKTIQDALDALHRVPQKERIKPLVAQTVSATTFDDVVDFEYNEDTFALKVSRYEQSPNAPAAVRSDS